jgi:SAM-dependent methyltransferase
VSETPPDDDLRTSYDQLPYETRARRKTHPDTLATVATVFGLKPPPVETARVLELGCGTGENLLAIACALRGAACVGVDFSAPQITQAKALAAAAGIGNVRFICSDFKEIAETPAYDYVIAHGLLSWIPPDSHDDLIALCSACLVPGGLLYLSYNALPGWYQRRIVRDFLMQETAGLDDVASKVKNARTALASLTNTVKPLDWAYGRIIADENANVAKLGDSYLAHDLLETHNTAFYFSDIVQRSEARDLHYVGEAGFEAMVPDTYPASIADALKTVPDLLAREQRLDFLTNRTFRESIFVKGQPPARQPDHRTLAGLYVASPLSRQTNQDDTQAEISYQSPNGTEIAVEAGVAHLALDHLVACYPEALSLEEILGHIQQTQGRAVEQNAIMKMIGALFSAYARGLIHLHSAPPSVRHAAPDRPVAPALARAQSQRGSRVTTALLENIEIDDTDCLAVLPNLDGHHDRTALAQHLSGASDDAPSRLDAALDKLARAGLIVDSATP